MTDLQHPAITAAEAYGYPEKPREHPICHCCGREIMTPRVCMIYGEFACWDCIESNTYDIKDIEDE